MTTLTIHQPRTAGLLAPLTTRVADWRASRRLARMQREVAATNTGRITIREHLARLGADDTVIRSLESRVGKAVAAAYRAQTGAEPAKSGAVIVRGEIYPVFAYGWDQLDLISRTALTFPAVAALIGA